MEWYLKVMRDNYSNSSGRARRQEYWMFTLFYFIFTIVAVIIVAIVGGLLSVAAGENVGYAIAGLLIIIWFLAHFIPSLAVTIRRIHDTGNSGWLYLLVLVPYLGSIVIFVFTVIDGQKQENKWGPDPKLDSQ